MFKYLKYGAVIGVTALGGAYYGINDKAETDAILAQYQFVGKDLERFNTCKVAMIEAGVVYDDSTDAGGCACTVEQVKEKFAEKNRDWAHDIDALDSKASGVNLSEHEFWRAAQKISAKHNVSASQTRPMTDRVFGIIEYCAIGNSSTSNAPLS